MNPSASKRSILSGYFIASLVVLLTLLLVAWYGSERFYHFFIEQQKSSLAAYNTSIIASMKSSSHSMIKQQCAAFNDSRPSVRVTLITTEGAILCDSEKGVDMASNLLLRLEVTQAVNTNLGFAIRYSQMLEQKMLYVTTLNAAATKDLSWIVRTAIPLSEIDALNDELNNQFYILMCGVVLILGFIMWLIHSKVNQPIEQIVVSAKAISKGQFNVKIPSYDIKEIDQLGDALNHMTGHLGRLENLRQEFVTNVSHELKTPITTIQSYVETLLEGAVNNEKDLKRFLQIVHKQNTRLASIVDDLFMLSRLENAPLSDVLELQPINIKDLLSSAMDMCSARAENKNIQIKLKVNTRKSIRADLSLLLQAIINLLDNAIKFSDQHSEIKLIANKVGDEVVIKVSDSGPGISEQHLERIFERFYRVDKSRSRREGGTGLGLAIVKHIIQLHHGSISVSNNKKAGTCFSLAFKCS